MSIRWIVFFVLPLLLSGCLIPEKFESSVDFEKNGSYEFKFDGVMAYGPALVGGVTLSPRDEAKLRAEIEKYKTRKGYKKFDYIGNGRFKVEFSDKLAAAEDGGPLVFKFPEGNDWIIEVFNPGNLGGAIVVRGRGMKPSDVAELKKSGLEPKGRFIVKNNGLKVLTENADNKRWLGGYEWNLVGVSKAPNISLVADPITLGDIPIIENESEVKDAFITYCMNGDIQILQAKNGRMSFLVGPGSPRPRKCTTDKSKTQTIKALNIPSLGGTPKVLGNATGAKLYCNNGRIHSMQVEDGKVMFDGPSELTFQKCRLDSTKKLTIEGIETVH